MSAKVLRLFSTPVLIHEVEDADQLNGKLEQLIIDKRSQETGVKLSNRGGWQSGRDFPQWAGKVGQRITRLALDLASEHSLGPDGKAPPDWVADVWANVSEAGHFNMPHVHGGSFWSAVYYVRAGEGEGGHLVLHDPRMPGLRMHAPGVHFKGMGAELRAEIRPRTGLMVLFPAWLSHSVEPWSGEGQRISIAMNIRARLQPR